jgi:O-methyltransferase involved in polyketide biosynthesis
MSENTNQDLSGVAETLLMTLYIRATESQRPDALIKDEKAVALVTSMSYDFDRIRQLKMDDDDKLDRQLSAWGSFALGFLARPGT